MFYYALDENRNPVPVSVLEWEFKFDDDARIVKQETVSGIYVSTVFVGVDYSFGMGGPPLVFETMAFDDRGDMSDNIVCHRYATWNEALKGHNEIVSWVKNTANATLELLREVIKQS